MVEFNSDGSIKIAENIQESSAKKKARVDSKKCLMITKQVVSDKAPKSCIINLKLSDKMDNIHFVSSLFYQFCGKAEVPARLHKISEKEYNVEIGSHFKRCSDCTALINRFKEYLDGNVIVDKGNCPLEDKDFAYEDHFE